MDAPRLDQETVERLLAGSSSGAQTAPAALVKFLDVVRAAPGAGELDGEAAAVAAFRAVRATTSAARDASERRPAAVTAGRGPVADATERRPAAVTAGRGPVAGRRGAGDRPARRFAGLLGAKLAVATLAASLTGGVALAAVTGNLPGATGDEAPPVGITTGARPTAAPTPPARPSRPATGPRAGAPDPSSPAGLCAAYRAVPEIERRRALNAPAFAGLVTAAGSAGRVPGYCAALLDGSAPAGSGTPTPGDPSERAEHPTGGPPGGVLPTPGPAGPPAGTARPPTATATAGPLVSPTGIEPTTEAARTPAGPGSGADRTPGDDALDPAGPGTGGRAG
ncbi:hypothetical protein ACH495_14790 [Micromonospora sp. NPDC018662]|uniref:hypothetical protein n=1 Tax=Micromonospora sp. NPDC018662 TaxID=3364238 RepID=UPI0037A9465A